MANKRKPKTERKRLVDRLDKVFSLFIRCRDMKETGGRCAFQVCGRGIECCFHFITRSKHSVRWDERNAAGSCLGCNFNNEFNPHPYVIWYVSKYGLAAYETLFQDSNRIAKFSCSDLERMIGEYEKKIEELKKQPDTPRHYGY